MILARERLIELQDHLLLYFTGISRLAPEVAQTVIDNITADRLRSILAEVAPRLDPEARWAGDSLFLPGLGVPQVDVLTVRVHTH